jgi:broad specificity phosphatase PhoE
MIAWGKGKEDADVTPIIAHVKKHFFSHDDSVKHSNEELFKDVLARAQHVVELIESRPEQRIVVVTHREILRFMIMYLLFKEKATPDIYLLIREHFIHANTGITKCIQGKKGWELHTWSDESHLG